MKIIAKRMISLCLTVTILATTVGTSPPAMGAVDLLSTAYMEEKHIATQSEAVRIDERATPSDAESTLSEAERKFVRAEPEETPEYYKKTSHTGISFWKFEDRYGNEHYRDFGFFQGKVEFPLWYEANDKGIVEELPVPVDLDEEFYDLAPYVYESISPAKSNWSDLSKQVLYDEESIFLYNRVSKGYTNWDASTYTIWSVGGLKEENSKEEGLNEYLGLFFYGKIRNDHDSVEQWYFADIDGNVWSMKLQQRLALTALAADFSDLIFYYDGKHSNSSTTPDHTDSFDYNTQTGESYLTLWNPGGLSGYTFLGWIVGGSSYGASGGRDKQYPQDYPYSFVGGGFYLPSATLQWKNILPGYNGTLRGAWKPNGTYYLMLVDEPVGTIPSCGNAFSRFKYIIVRGGGETVDLSEYPSTKTGYIFDGWYTQPNGGGIRYDSLDLTSNTTLYSHFAPRLNTVRFYDSDGNLLKAEQVSSGNQASAPTEMPKKEGYMFTGWDKSFTNIISDIDITAIYEKSCILTFDANDGTIYGQSTYDVKVLADKIINNYVDFDELKDNVNRPGYKFLGWYATPEGGSPSYGITSKISSNTTIYAKWTNISNTVTFYRNYPNGDTGTYKTKTVFYGESLGEFPEANPVGKGLRLKGWYLNSSGTGEPVTSDYIMGDVPLKLYAQWEDFDVTYRMHYGLDDTGFSDEVKAKSTVNGQDLAKSYFPDHASSKLVIPGYLTNYWSSKEDGTGGVLSKSTGSTWFPTEETVDIYLCRQAKTLYFTLYYPKTTGTGYNSGNVSVSPYAVYGQIINAPNLAALTNPAYIPSGKVFYGFYTAATNGDEIDFSKPLCPIDDTGTNNYIRMSVYLLCVNEISTLTFQDYDGTVLDTQTVKFGDPIVYPPNPTRSGYIFTGWDMELGTTSSLTEDTVVTAQYKLAEFELQLNGNGGTIDNFPAKTYKFENGTNIDQALADAGSLASLPYYAFAGWYTESFGGVKLGLSGNIMPESNLTLYAHWVRSSNEVIYKDWDGSEIDKQEVVIGGNATPPADPVRDGYTFIGWNKPSTNIQTDTIITAQYSKNGYMLTLDGNGGMIGGSLSTDQVVTYGESFDQTLTDGATIANRKYYTFDGWYTAATGGSKYANRGNIMPAKDVTIYAHWVRSSNEVIYQDWAGREIDTQEVTIGGNATPPAGPARLGYTFIGWDKPSTNIQMDTIITAQYSKNGYTLTLDGSGGMIGGSFSTNQVVSYGQSFDQILADGAAEATRKFYVFGGWYAEPIGGSKYANSGNTMPAKDVTVYVHWVRSSNEVIYKDWDEREIDTQEVTIGGNATPPADPVRDGYTFIGWNKPSTNIQIDTIITAQYSKDGYTLTLDGNGGMIGGSFSTNQVVTYGQLFDQILADGAAEAIRKFYVFGGWYAEPIGGSKYVDSGNTMPAKDVTVYAHWVRSSNEVIYKDWDGREIDTQEVTSGGNATPPADLVRDGYTFIGWNKPSTNIQTDTIITAMYSKNGYMLTLDGNGGMIGRSFSTNQICAYEESFDKALTDGAAITTWKFYTFGGWYTEPIGGSKYADGGNTMPAKDVTVYAHWVRSSNEVIYKDWNGREVDTQDVVIGGNATPPEDPARAGYTFIGWDKPSTNIQTDTIITAQYSKNGYTLTLDGNGGMIGGSFSTKQVCIYGEPFDQVLSDGATIATRKFYTFGGWYTAPIGGSKYADSGNTMPVKDVTVYAHWVRSSNEVIYKDWDGREIDTQDVVIGGNATPPADPTRLGNTFIGWDKPSTNIQIDTTIMAQYSKNSYTLTLDGNGGMIDGSTIEEHDITYGTSFDQILIDGRNKVSWPGHTFEGWFSAPIEGNHCSYSGNLMLPNDVIIYAHWKVVSDPTEQESSKPDSNNEEEIITVPVPPNIDSKTKPIVPDTGGSFVVNPDNPYDVTFTNPDGSIAKDEWVGDGENWYHVDPDGKLNYDWYLEGEKTWYKLNREPGIKFGTALTGWNYEPMDNKRYFFDPSTTKMLTGWQFIDHKWYYFTEKNEIQTYYGSNSDGWLYDSTKPGKPYGSMYQIERTPDGYIVGQDGSLLK